MNFMLIHNLNYMEKFTELERMHGNMASHSTCSSYRRVYRLGKKNESNAALRMCLMVLHNTTRNVLVRKNMSPRVTKCD